MKHWTIGKILMITAVVAFLAMLTQAEGCGDHRSHISDLQLTPDGKALAVARADGRVAVGSYRRYFSDLWLTRSLLRASDGHVIKTLDSHPVEGSSSDLHLGSRTPSFAFSDQHIYIAAEDYRLDCFDFQGAKLSSRELPYGVARVAVSSDERYVLYCTQFGLVAILIDAQNGRKLWQRVCDYRWAGAITISQDSFATIDDQVSRYGTCTNADKIETSNIQVSGKSGSTIRFAKSNSMIVVGWDKQVELCDLSTGKIQSLQAELLGMASDGSRLVLAADNGLEIMNLESDERSAIFPYSTNIACVSNDGARLFYAREGQDIVCVDLSSGKQLWSVSAPGHYRPSMGWLVAFALICVFAYRGYKRIAGVAERLFT